MSILVNPILCPNYDDYIGYSYKSCILKHWPEMWDGERQAEHGLWEERLKLKSMSYGFSPTHSSDMPHRVKHIEIEDLVLRALVELAEEGDWTISDIIDGKVIYRIR